MKKLVRSLGVAALCVVGYVSAADEVTLPLNCCPAANILNAHLAPKTTRRLEEDSTCTGLRSDNIVAWEVHTDATWVTQGSAAYIEDDFTRYAHDLSGSLSDVYWKDTADDVVPKAARVIVMSTTDSPTTTNVFPDGWETNEANDPAVLCPTAQLQGKDMANALSDKSAYFVILADTTENKSAWNDWLGNAWVTAQSGDLCAGGCNVVVGKSNGEDEFLNDVLAALSPTFAEFQDCQICLPTTPTKAPSAASHLGAGVCVPAATLGLAALAAL